MSSGAMLAILKKYRKKVNNKVCDVLVEIIFDLMMEKGILDDELKYFLEQEKDIEVLKLYLKATSVAKDKTELMEYVKKRI